MELGKLNVHIKGIFGLPWIKWCISKEVTCKKMDLSSCNFSLTFYSLKALQCLRTIIKDVCFYCTLL